MPSADLYPCHAGLRLTEALADSPVVLIHGPRQCGKTTLARAVGEPLGYEYVTFDDVVARGAAEADPAGFVLDLPERAILDEVQRVPSLFTAIKASVDRRRQAGRFLLTGSANVLLVPTLTDSLAGRMEVLRLHPLAQGELAARIVAGGYPAALQRASAVAALGIVIIWMLWSSATCATWRASPRSTPCRDSSHSSPARPHDCLTSRILLHHFS